MGRGDEKLCFLFQSDKNSGAIATYSSHRLIMGKEEIIQFFSVSMGIIGFFLLQKCLLSSPLLSKSVNLIGCRRGKKGQFSSKCLKFFFSETVRGMKLKLDIHAQDISLYKSCVFHFGRIRTLVAMATYSSHRLIMGKVEIDNLFCHIGDIWIFFYRNVY